MEAVGKIKIMTQGRKLSKNDDRSNKTDVMFDYCFVFGRVAEKL
jgi:hypothetical protein